LPQKNLYLTVFAAFIFTSCADGGVNSSADVYFPHQASDLVAEAAIEYGRLPNGLRYAVMANETPSNTATLLMRFDTGSIKHMAFNGSTNIPEGEMIKRLEKFGLAFGADTNASTSFDETIYQLELPEVNDDILDETLMIMRETASNLTLDPTSTVRLSRTAFRLGLRKLSVL